MRRTTNEGGTVDVGRDITVAIPPVFEAYATFHELDDDAASVTTHERAVVRQLVAASGDQPWWLGYPRVRLYAGWDYVLVQAGAEQALAWRVGHMRSLHGVLPDVFFPVDRSWLVSALWDDAWTYIGGPAELIDRLRLDPEVRARRVRLGEDAAPPAANSSEPANTTRVRCSRVPRSTS